ncbi:ribonuclease D [uncultured Thalassospira sp.]|jgi:ribonuclease D|uniref:ribonuclease D n=1 Tax=uncultured Thalassospira sp. TaxID=404382 RepID=UPI0030D9C1D2|tara:strand:+ start:9264 stop:10505 length:1242 start_codon:yes stop_codon:yes gene_type:complete
METITKTEDLRVLCDRLRQFDYVTVDTEFMRDSTYWPQLCLVQVCSPEFSDTGAAIDPLAEGIDLTPLFDLMGDESVIKVFHAARQDIEIFVHLNGKVPHPVFDTQVAAMVLGYGDQVGYETLVNKVARKNIDKSMRFTDWSRRPLSTKQVSYAISDVTHLRTIYENFHERLAANDRAPWLFEEMERLTDPGIYTVDPAQAWLRLKTRSNSPKFLAVARALCEWREIEAQRKNLPRNRVLRDDTLLDIAARHPLNENDLDKTRGVGRNFGASKQGQAIIGAINAALAEPQENWPVPKVRTELPAGIGPTVELLKVLLKLCSEEKGVAQRLVASSDDLQNIAADDNADVAALHGWRRELFGQYALRLKHGQIGLKLENGEVALVELEMAFDAEPKADAELEAAAKEEIKADAEV